MPECDAVVLHICCCTLPNSCIWYMYQLIDEIGYVCVTFTWCHVHVLLHLHTVYVCVSVSPTLHMYIGLYASAETVGSAKYFVWHVLNRKLK